MNTTQVHPAPPLWQIEFTLCDLISQQTSLARGKVTPSSRLLEDLQIDSLELVELILTIEEEFGVSIPDDIGKQMFVREPVTVAVLAEIVLHQWGTGKPRREGWFDSRTTTTPTTAVPFTQLTGRASYREWTSRPLYEQMAPTPEGFAQFRRHTDGMRCILVPEAEAEIGDDTGEPDQRPCHRANLSSFFIDAEPVSVTAFARFLNSLTDTSPPAVETWFAMQDNDRRGVHAQVRVARFGGWEAVPGTEHQPMVLVSWFGANAYSLWANRSNEKPGATEFNESFLPTESQWEYAARGASRRKFPWGDAAATPELALYNLHTARRHYKGILPLAPVNARLGLSPFGLHHMAGNIWQWCADFYEPTFYGSAEAALPNPRCTRHTGVRVERGGSWIGPADLIQSSYRRGRPPLARGRCLGFRCVGLPPVLPT